MEGCDFDFVLFLDSGDGHINVCFFFFFLTECVLYKRSYISQFNSEEMIQIIAPWQVHMTNTGQRDAWAGQELDGYTWVQTGVKTFCLRCSASRSPPGWAPSSESPALTS